MLWIEEGKRFTILGSILIAVCLLGIFTTDSILMAALLGFLLFPFGYMTFKSAEGWSVVRSSEKRRKIKARY